VRVNEKELAKQIKFANNAINKPSKKKYLELSFFFESKNNAALNIFRRI
jgi:hypothetical protein